MGIISPLTGFTMIPFENPIAGLAFKVSQGLNKNIKYHH